MNREIKKSDLSIAVAPNKNISLSACSDYLQEMRLKRILKGAIEDPEIIKKLKGKRGFGKTDYMVSKTIKEVVEFKVQRLTNDQVRRYIKKIDKNVPLFKCLFQMKKEGNRW